MQPNVIPPSVPGKPKSPNPTRQVAVLLLGMVMTSTTILASPDADKNKDLAAHYSFDEGEGTVAHDASGATSYEIQASPDPITANSWVHKLTVTKSSTTMTALTSGTKMWFRVRGVGAAGPGVWSDPATKSVP